MFHAYNPPLRYPNALTGIQLHYPIKQSSIKIITLDFIIYVDTFKIYILSINQCFDPIIPGSVVQIYLLHLNALFG